MISNSLTIDVGKQPDIYQARANGRDAFNKGMSISDNPHDSQPKQREWAQGYADESIGLKEPEQLSEKEVWNIFLGCTIAIVFFMGLMHLVTS